MVNISFHMASSEMTWTLRQSKCAVNMMVLPLVLTEVVSIFCMFRDF